MSYVRLKSKDKAGTGMAYKPSKYNYYIIKQNNIIVFNSFSGEIVRTDKVSEAKKLLNAENQEKDCDYLFEEFYTRGFIVDDSSDEEISGQIKYYNNIFDSTLNLVLMPTEQCNFRCSYCYECFKNGKMSDDVQMGITRYLQNNIHKYTQLNIEWFGGEPLLATDVIERLAPRIQSIMKTAHKKLTSSITTNGYYLNYETFKSLQRYQINSYQVTIDGLRDTHDKMRKLSNGAGTFDVIINNLRSIRDSSKSSTFDICIRSNLTKNNIDSISPYLQFLHKEFGNDRRFSFYFRPVGEWGGKPIDVNYDSLIKTQSDYYEPIINASYTLNYNFYSELLRNTICSAAKKNSFVIGSDGTIYKCTMLFDRDFNKLGKLSSNGKMSIDSNLLANWLNPLRDKGECKDCFLKCLCKGGTCPASNWISDIHRCDGYEKNSIKSVLSLLLKDSLNNPESSVVTIV